MRIGFNRAPSLLLLLTLVPSRPCLVPLSGGTSRRHRRAHLQPSGAPPPAPPRPATALEPAVLAGVVEDHSYEQFFFDEPTQTALLGLMARHERPLLLCTPSLAVAAEAAGQPYLLLDMDERFGFLRSFRPFNLDDESAGAGVVHGYEFDAVFCDPPFANVDLQKLRTTLGALCGGRVPRPPLYIAYNAKKEEKLLAAFADEQLRRGRQLGYMSVKPNTQKHLHLYVQDLVLDAAGAAGSG